MLINGEVLFQPFEGKIFTFVRRSSVRFLKNAVMHQFNSSYDKMFLNNKYKF